MQVSLKAARVNAGLAQADVARLMGVSPATVINWEKGRTEPSASQFVKLTELMGLRCEDIFLPGLVSST